MTDQDRPIVKAIIFDIDGVVIRQRSFYTQALSRRKYSDPVQEIGKYYRSAECSMANRGQADEYTAIEPYLRKSGWKKSINQFYRNQYTHEIRYLDAKLLKRIKTIRKSGISCYIGSNQTRTRKDQLLRDSKLLRVFDRSFFSCEIGHCKPDEKYWVAVLEEICKEHKGLHPSEVVFLDDQEKNVAAAIRHGMSGFIVRSSLDIDAVLRVIEQQKNLNASFDAKRSNG